jgi:outer membrane protein assembly factor BamB
MGRRVRVRLGLLGAVAALAVAVAGCGGGGGGEKTTAGTTAATTATETTATVPAGPIELVRWPRFWATRDSAETGSDGNLNTQFYTGFDDRAVVYNGQDVVRVLRPSNGNVIGRVLLPTGRFICAVSPRREIDAGVAVFGVGELRGEATCHQVIGVSTRTGKKLWSQGDSAGPSRSANIDQRDGKVLFTDRLSITALDAKTGRVVWQRSARKLVRQPTEIGGCEISAALAADAPVVIVYPNSCDSFEGERLLGLDLATGRQLWRKRDPRDPKRYSSYQTYLHPLDGRYVGPVDDFERPGKPAMAAFFDSQTGEATAYAIPRFLASDGRQPGFENCSDSGTTEGLSFDSWCIFIGGGHALYVDSFPGSKADGIDIAATDPATGELQWRYRARPEKGDKDEEAPWFHVLGFNADRTEFWIADRRDRIQRIRLEDGEIVGRGRPGPPFSIPRFMTIGHEAMYVRGQPGITDARSGLDFYKTDAP